MALSLRGVPFESGGQITAHLTNARSSDESAELPANESCWAAMVREEKQRQRAHLYVHPCPHCLTKFPSPSERDRHARASTWCT